AQDEPVDAYAWPGGLERAGACEEGLGDDAGFEAGEGRAEAVVDAVAEAEVVVGVAAQVEAVGLREVAGVAVGRREGDHQGGPGGDGCIGDSDIFGGAPEEGLDGSVVAERLLDGCRNER